MYLARYSTLIVAALLTSPALWHAFVQHDLGYPEAATRFLIAVPVAAIMLWILRGLAAGYRRGLGLPARRSDDGEPTEAAPKVLEPDAVG
jgi:hypothetical protein